MFDSKSTERVPHAVHAWSTFVGLCCWQHACMPGDETLVRRYVKSMRPLQKLRDEQWWAETMAQLRPKLQPSKPQPRRAGLGTSAKVTLALPSHVVPPASCPCAARDALPMLAGSRAAPDSTSYTAAAL